MIGIRGPIPQGNQVVGHGEFCPRNGKSVCSVFLPECFKSLVLRGDDPTNPDNPKAYFDPHHVPVKKW